MMINTMVKLRGVRHKCEGIWRGSSTFPAMVCEHAIRARYYIDSNTDNCFLCEAWCHVEMRGMEAWGVNSDAV
jgi:hypothetical protein